MANVFNYVEQFGTILDKKYAAESKTYALTQSNKGIAFVNANTIKVPKLTLGGFKDHKRGGTYNQASLTNDFEIMKLSHDRDAEFFIDAMDVDETNSIVSIANIQNQFEEEQAIPEWDSYRLSKLYDEYTTKAKKTPETVEASVAAVMKWFDDATEKMDDLSVPEDGRILYCTALYKKIFNKALTRQLTAKDRVVETTIERLGQTQIVGVPSARMKTKYDYTDGCQPASDAAQMCMILVHPSCVIARDKYAYMKAFAPGSDSRTADNWIYQVRKYGDLFLLENKSDGVEIALSASSTVTEEKSDT